MNRFTRKTEQELRQDFDVATKDIFNQLFGEMKESVESIEKNHQETVSKMRAEGFYEEANAAEQQMQKQKDEFLEKAKVQKETAFQTYLSQYNEFAEKMEFVENLTDETIAKAKERTGKSIKKMESIFE